MVFRFVGIWSRLLTGPAAVDKDAGASDEARGVAGEVESEAADFCGFAPTAEGDFGEEGLIFFRIVH